MDFYQFLTLLKHLPDNISFWFWIGLLLTIYSLLSYRKIWQTHKKDLHEKSFLKSLEYIISHIPSSESRPWKHVKAGMSFCIGICLLGGSTIGVVFNNQNINVHALSITAAGLVFAVLISFISFWTLWQTKRIEHIQGYRITHFRSLITKLNEEMKYLVSDYAVANEKNAQDHHRFLFITTNPYLGYLSFPNEEPTEEFKNLFHSLVDHVRESLVSQASNHNQIRVEIVCGNLRALHKFHLDFYNGKPDGVAKAKKATREIEARFKSINDMTQGKVLRRVRNIPRSPQFAIVGNTLFDFTLDARAPYTEISETNIVADRKRCDIYTHTFNLLRDSLK